MNPIQRIKFWILGLWWLKGVKVWHYCLIYPSARIGRGTSIGSFTEIGPNVKIGERCRIGAHCFIPEGVEIGNDCFIGPGTIFSNDMYPPSPKTHWIKTKVGDRASLGAGVRVRPGAEITEDVMIGMGAVVVKNTTERDFIYTGMPARATRKREKGGEDVEINA